MYKKPCVTHYDTANKAITDEPTLVYWVFLDVAALGTIGTLYIRDGFSSTDPIKVKAAMGYSRLCPFYPPIRCAHGLYISKDAALTSYTVGYRREREIDSKEKPANSES